MVKMVPASKRRQNGAGAKNRPPKKGPKGTLRRSFKGRLTTKGTPGSVKKGSDARLKIISKNRSKVVDARDKLASLARNSDAREKLEKIRNLKQGKVGVWGSTTLLGGGSNFNFFHSFCFRFIHIYLFCSLMSKQRRVVESQSLKQPKERFC